MRPHDGNDTETRIEMKSLLESVTGSMSYASIRHLGTPESQASILFKTVRNMDSWRSKSQVKYFCSRLEETAGSLPPTLDLLLFPDTQPSAASKVVAASPDAS